MESPREAKLKWKRDVQEREEEKRKEIDKEEEVIKAKLTSNIIKRAHDLQYEEKEKVKILRSQQLYTDVVETRKKQVEERKEKDRKLLEEERRWHEESVKQLKDAERRNKDKIMQQKQKAIENAEVMKNQRIEIENERKKLLMSQRQAEEDLIKRVQAETATIEDNERKRKNQVRKECKEEMEMLFSDIKRKNQAMERKEMEDEKKRQDDIARMSFIASARAQLELKHFEERQTIRKLLSDRAAEELKLRSNREVEIFIKEQRAQESKERAKKEEETRLRQQREKEIHESRQEQIRLRQQRKKIEADNEKLVLQQFESMTLNEIAREKRKENDMRNRHIQMRQFQLGQIEEKQKLRIWEKNSKLLEAKKVCFIILF